MHKFGAVNFIERLARPSLWPTGRHSYDRRVGQTVKSASLAAVAGTDSDAGDALKCEHGDRRYDSLSLSLSLSDSRSSL